ncbi:MAG: TlpA disulfide reductase family protein [Clostridia bacterium]|nr:TlpA disulfide reductase family protein [Clostridia bacterium]
MSTKNKVILMIVLIVVAIAAGILVAKRYIGYLNSTHYISYEKRTSSIVDEVNDRLLQDYISKKGDTLVIFWASWCPSCIKERDDINTFMQNNPKIPTIIVSHDKTLEELQSYLTQNNLKWQVIFDKDKIIRKSIDSESTGIPACFLLDKNGKLLDKHVGVLTADEMNQFYHMTLEK